MANQSLRIVLRQLQEMVARSESDELPDRQLIERFLAGRDEQAFATLVMRHGPLVWGVCWRALRHVQDAEDAFQATFLVLARKSRSVDWHASVANWLYGVACRVAAEARGRIARRRRCEMQLENLPEEPAMPETAARELCAALDEELQRLPVKYRAALVECYFEGRTTDQAAQQLKLSLRTLERRLAQGRERLRTRLLRRGFTLSGVLVATALSDAAHAGVPPALIAATARSAVVPSEATTAAAALATAALKGVTMSKLRLLTLALLMLAASTGSGWFLLRLAAVPPPRVKPVLQPGPTHRLEFAKPPIVPPAVAILSRRLWNVMDLVDKNHLKPPTREEMILAAMHALLKAAEAPVPAALAQRAAVVAREDQLAVLLRDFWPGAANAAETVTAPLARACLDGLYAGVPGKLSYYTPMLFQVDEQLRNNRYVGIGVQLGMDATEKVPCITFAVRRGMALRAGARSGDLLLAVDGKSTRNQPQDKVIDWLRGEVGTNVTLTVRQPGAAERTLHLTRAIIPMETLYGLRRAGADDWDYVADREAGIAYACVRSVKASTLHELRQLERRLQADGLRALVLDFRNSVCDGDLRHVALVADSLLGGGLLWTVRGKDTTIPYHSQRNGLFRGWPLLVLMNDQVDTFQSALLAALQDHRRAVLVGEPTKSGGLVRTMVPLPNHEGAVSVISGQLERPAKDRGWPVEPDHVVAMTKAQQEALQKWLLDKELPEPPPVADDRPPEDPQLVRGLALLRAALQGVRPPAVEGT
jgi:RNA polymerase sigma factor (sigma-70 family)